MDFFFTITNNYVPFCATTIISLFENNKDLSLHVHILCQDLTLENKDKILRISNKYGQVISFVYLSDEQLSIVNNILKEKKYKNVNYHQSVLYRLFVADIFSNLSHIIYMDCDMIVTNSIKDISLTDDNVSLMAVPDLFRMCDYHRLKLDQRQHSYFNSGLLSINLNYFRNHQITKKLIKYLTDPNTNIWLPDQDALNAVLSGTVKYLHPKYNCMSMYFAKKSYLENRIWYTDMEKILEATNNPAIVHFCGAKPWYKGGYLPYREEWMKYFAMTEWFNILKIDYQNGWKGKYRHCLKECIKKCFPNYSKRIIVDIYK